MGHPHWHFRIIGGFLAFTCLLTQSAFAEPEAMTPSPQEGAHASNQERPFSGIGIRLGFDIDKHALVTSLTEGGPAALAGLWVGDEILEIEGRATDGRALEDLAKQLRGAKGSTVELKIQRNDRAPFNVSIVRGFITSEMVSSEANTIKLEPSYYRIDFGEAKQRLSDLRSEKLVASQQFSSLEAPHLQNPFMVGVGGTIGGLALAAGFGLLYGSSFFWDANTRPLTFSLVGLVGLGTGVLAGIGANANNTTSVEEHQKKLQALNATIASLENAELAQEKTLGHLRAAQAKAEAVRQAKREAEAEALQKEQEAEESRRAQQQDEIEAQQKAQADNWQTFINALIKRDKATASKIGPSLSKINTPDYLIGSHNIATEVNSKIGKFAMVDVKFDSDAPGGALVFLRQKEWSDFSRSWDVVYNQRLFLPDVSSGRFVSGESFTFVGRITGTYKYTTVLGGSATVPSVRAEYIF
ncbi:PDZ domain-containing protein [bacterium]|nr:PDZ domain-containing protein [bacterium]